ncbi:predicted protein [Histoplasma capsulatum H143]|uniref:Uncharacterized protein n=1 Tax=Ajellomyces capsulatus (strain H143) TaxID=544712 RepID=C6HSL8_AJECH|nr:predicted protein [Histoplasma capsulatum H143]
MLSESSIQLAIEDLNHKKLLISPKLLRGTKSTVKHWHAAKGIQSKAASNEVLVLEKEVLQVQNNALTTTLQAEKQHQKCSKPLGLFDRKHPGEAQLFSPNKVAAARVRAVEQEAERTYKAAQIQEIQLQKAIQRDQKAQEVAECKALRLEARKRSQDEAEAAAAAAAVQQPPKRRRTVKSSKK